MTFIYNYYASSDALIIRVRNGTITHTVDFESVLVDFAANGKIVRFEILDIKKNLKKAEKIMDQLTQIK